MRAFRSGSVRNSEMDGVAVDGADGVDAVGAVVDDDDDGGLDFADDDDDDDDEDDGSNSRIFPSRPSQTARIRARRSSSRGTAALVDVESQSNNGSFNIK